MWRDLLWWQAAEVFLVVATWWHVGESTKAIGDSPDLVYVAAIVLHLCRIFFTGAFRRPRQRTWVVGIAVLLLAMAQGLAGHSLPDDLLSGMSLQVVWSAVLAIPVIGPEVAYLLFGGEFPSPETIPRLFVLHTMLLPALLVGLVAVHLGTVVSRRRQRDPRPARAFASTSLLLLVAAMLALLGGVAQINPIWQLGPYHPARVTSPAQPDWYLAFLDGLVRLAPPWGFELFGWTISEMLWPALVWAADTPFAQWRVDPPAWWLLLAVPAGWLWLQRWHDGLGCRATCELFGECAIGIADGGPQLGRQGIDQRTVRTGGAGGRRHGGGGRSAGHQ